MEHETNVSHAALRLRERIGAAAHTAIRTQDLESIAAEVEAELAAARPTLDEEEQEAMDHLIAFMDHLRAWGLRSNQDELTGAVHVLQGFVIQHMLRRLAPDSWSLWYASQADTPPEAPMSRPEPITPDPGTAQS